MQTPVARRTMTPAEFEAYAALPENRERRLELIAGEVIEVVSDNYAAEIAAIIIIRLGQFVLEHNLGRVTGPDGGYMVDGARLIPDVAFVSSVRHPKRKRAAWTPYAPDLAVEVLSPGNSDDEIRLKVVSYLRAGTTVWVVDPNGRRVEVYEPDTSPVVRTVGDTLSGGDVLPGFTLAVAGIFPE
jgi:Uma2 family endonuclease